MPRYNRFVEYSVAVALTVAIVLYSIYLDDPLSLTLAKAAVGPMSFLAQRGVTLTFTSEASRTRWTFPYIEGQALHALMWGCLWVVVLWQADMTMQRAVTVFVTSFFIWLAAMITLDYMRRADVG